MTRITIHIIIGALMFAGVGCSDDIAPNNGFDIDRDLNTEFPESLFGFEFDYSPLKNGEQILDTDNILLPVPKDEYSFTNFESISDVKNENGIRFVECNLEQNGYGVPDSASFAINIFQYNYVDEASMKIKLNVSTSGDALNGDPYEKHILLEFLEEGKTYPTGKDQLGAIELTYYEQNTYSKENQSKPIWVGIDANDNIGESDYTVKIISVEDYDDLTREGELIKSALKVELEFEGFIGVSSHPHLEEEIKADQWAFTNGRASFIVDYLQ